jgi:hypothetical protein
MKNYILLLSFAILGACGGGSSTSTLPGSNTPITLTTYKISKGVAQKGPLQIGSTVTIAELDDSLNPTGKVFITEVTDNLGNFQLGSTISTKLALIVAQGFFMDENTGDFTSSAITLRGISDLSVETAPSVNVLTTLQYIRLKNLISAGASFQAAYKQSQEEVLRAFGVDPIRINNLGSLYQMKINGSSDADGVLLAISATMGKAAAMRNGSSTAAQLSDIMNTIASDLSQSGTITTSSIKSELTAAQIALDANAVRTLVQNFYANRGITISAPLFEDWISKDGTNSLPRRTQISPSNFSFASSINARPNQQYTSQEVTVAGLLDNTNVNVVVNSGATIMKNGVAISGLYSFAANGDRLAIKTTSSSYGNSVNSTISIGALSNSWRLVSQAPAAVNPSIFTISATSNSIPNLSYSSSGVTISGLNDGEVAYVNSTIGSVISLNGVSTGTNSTIGQNGDLVTLSAMGPAYGATATYSVTIGSKSADWRLTAQTPAAVTPSSFTFASSTDEINQLVTSNSVTVSGLAAGEVAQANLTLSGTMPNGASLLVNGVVQTQFPAILNQGDQIALRTTLASTFGSSGAATLTIGTRAANWVVSTRKPSGKYYKRRGAANTYLDNWYSDGTTHAYYAIPFMPNASFSGRYFSLGFSNGSTDSVLLYSNNVNSDAPDALLTTATIGSFFNESTSFTYPYNGYSVTGSGTTFTDTSNAVYWLSTMIQGKFGSGINLNASSKYWIVVKWNNNFPHDSRVEASTGASFDFSQMKGSMDGVTWTNISTGILSAGAVPAMFVSD